MFTLETVGELDISKFIKQVFLGSDLGKLVDFLISLPRCIVSKTFWKSMKIIMAERFLPLMPSIYRRRAEFGSLLFSPV